MPRPEGDGWVRMVANTGEEFYFSGLSPQVVHDVEAQIARNRFLEITFPLPCGVRANIVGSTIREIYTHSGIVPQPNEGRASA